MITIRRTRPNARRTRSEHAGALGAAGARAAARLSAASCALALLLAGCDPLEVDAPTVNLPEDFANAAGAEAMRAAAIRSFNSAISPEARFSGMLADEFIMGSSTQSGAERFLDRRLSEEAEEEVDRAGSAYERLHTARIEAAQAIRQLRAYAPNTPPARIGQLFAFSGYAKLLLAEDYCPGMAFNEITPDHQLRYGRALTTDEMFDLALADLDTAVTLAADSARILGLARVGKARALLGLGRFAEAAEAAAPVPTDYVFEIEHTTEAPSQTNLLNFGTTRLRYSVADREGGNGLDFVSAGDPRVRVTARGRTFDNLNTGYSIDKYPTTTSPMVLASGIEARLIEAEAALRANDVTTWLGILNTLRAEAITPALPPLEDPGDERARVDLHFRERAFWLFATGHRLGDLRRLIRHYGRTPDEVFPTGDHHHGGPYGTATSIPFPAETEGLNPNVTGCTER